MCGPNPFPFWGLLCRLEGGVVVPPHRMTFLVLFPRPFHLIEGKPVVQIHLVPSFINLYVIINVLSCLFAEDAASHWAQHDFKLLFLASDKEIKQAINSLGKEA